MVTLENECGEKGKIRENYASREKLKLQCSKNYEILYSLSPDGKYTIHLSSFN